MTDVTTSHDDIMIVLKEKLANQETFTAYDVTKTLRERGFTVHHDDVRAVVHGSYGDGLMGANYTRELVDLGTALPPFQYKPVFMTPPVIDAPTNPLRRLLSLFRR